MRFDLTDLRLFLHVVEAGSITRGAERMHLAIAAGATSPLMPRPVSSGVSHETRRLGAWYSATLVNSSLDLLSPT